MVKPLLEKYPDLHIIQFDAHLDLMNELFGKQYSHGTVMHRIYELTNQPHRIFQVGIRSGSKEEFGFAHSHMCLFPINTESFGKQIELLEGKPIYLTLDLNVFDLSLIPGT